MKLRLLAASTCLLSLVWLAFLSPVAAYPPALANASIGPGSSRTDGASEPPLQTVDVQFGAAKAPSAQALSWRRSAVWTGNQAGPQDGNGRYWHDPVFDDSSWTTVSLPDSAFDLSADDRYYRAHFAWDGTSPASVYFVSDDGLTIYINGNLLGAWGNGWRQSGCVNNQITCVNTAIVPTQPIPASMLQPGDNVIAIDLWNTATCCFYYLNVIVSAGEPARQPIILVHGFQGYPGGKFRQCSDGVQHYGDPGVTSTLPNIANWLSQMGYDVWIAHLDSSPLYTPPIEENAQCLSRQVVEVAQATGLEVILVGHSMGGLVSRACLSLEECRNNVSALFTTGSPHAGLNYLVFLKLLARNNAPGVEDVVCKWQPALCQFSAEQILWFNLRNPNRSGIAYNFIGGTRTPFLAGWLVALFDGPNDGVVGAYSAVGRLWPTWLRVVFGPEAGAYWVDETHTPLVGYPTYFETEEGGTNKTEAFRCIEWLLGWSSSADCTPALSPSASTMQTEPALSATTADMMGHVSSGQTANHTVQVDTSGRSLFHLSWLTGTLSLTLTQPNGQVISPAYAGSNPSVVTYMAAPVGPETPAFAAYAFTSTLPGVYTLTISADEVGSDGTDYLAFVALETARTFTVMTNADLYEPGQSAIFTGTLQGPSGGIAGATVQAYLVRSDVVTATLSFSDLGGGIYRATYLVPNAPGYMQATFTALGNDGGSAFTRQVDRLLAIAPHAAQLAGVYTDRSVDDNGDGFNDALALDVRLTAAQVGTHTLSADLVTGGQPVAQATTYAVLGTGSQTVTLRFDGGDIRRSRLDGPYTVTNVYLVDLGAGGIPAEIASDVYATAAYQWQDFGFDNFYLPLVLRSR